MNRIGFYAVFFLFVLLSGSFLITEVCSNAIRNKLGGLSSKKMYVTKNNLTNGVNFLVFISSIHVFLG